MPEKKIKDIDLSIPVEKHDTAAWADIEGVKAESRVTVPSEKQVLNAKEYADANQK